MQEPRLEDDFGLKVDMAIANILSSSKAKNKFRVTTIFGEQPYVCDLTNIREPIKTTVQDNMMDYTNREVQTEKEARKLTSKLGYASAEIVQWMIKCSIMQARQQMSLEQTDLGLSHRFYERQDDS